MNTSCDPVSQKISVGKTYRLRYGVGSLSKSGMDDVSVKVNHIRPSKDGGADVSFYLFEKYKTISLQEFLDILIEEVIANQGV